MKILILANNCPWESWDDKIKQLKDWWSPIEMDFTLEHTNFKDIPWEAYTSTDGDKAMGIDKLWYDINISVPARMRGFDCVILTLNRADWKGGIYDGWNTQNNLRIHEIQVKGLENARYRFKGKRYDGDYWFNLARHELSHALYRDKGGIDNTHKWWEAGNLDEVKRELYTPTIIKVVQDVINPPKQYRYFNYSEVEGLKPELVSVLDDIRHDNGFPMVLSSGYRTNSSNHITGLAVDIKSTGKKFYEMVKYLRENGFTGEQVYNIVKFISDDFYKNDKQFTLVKNAIKHGIQRIGVYNKHAHLDMVKGKPAPTIWVGVSE